MLRRAYIWVPLILAGLGASACGSNTSAAAPGGGGGGRGRGGRGGDGAAAPVVAAKVTERDVPVDLAAIGNVEAYASDRCGRRSPAC